MDWIRFDLISSYSFWCSVLWLDENSNRFSNSQKFNYAWIWIHFQLDVVCVQLNYFEMLQNKIVSVGYMHIGTCIIQFDSIKYNIHSNKADFPSVLPFAAQLSRKYSETTMVYCSALRAVSIAFICQIMESFFW